MPSPKQSKPSSANEASLPATSKRTSPVKPGSNAEEGTADDTQAAKPKINLKARQRTRNKLLRAARAVMGSKGIEATAINDITEAAELSFGSFYNYFSSKEEVARAVFNEDAVAMADMLDATTSPEAGIAEVVGVNIRRTIHRGLTDPVWGWFLIHSVYSINDMVVTMGTRLARDIQSGIASRVFDVADVESTVDGIVGGMLFLLRQILEGARPASSVENLVQFVMRGLGVSREEVERIIAIDLDA